MKQHKQSLIFPLAVLAAMPTMAMDESMDLDLPVVISASRLNQSILHSPSAVTVIDKNMIAASAYTDIADVLRLVPGFQVVRADGRTHSVNSHGGGWEFSNRLQVLINGRTAYLPTLSVVDWDTLGVHINDIERIEVVRGPSASAYGSNSISAAINIITREPGLSEPYRYSVRVGNKGEREYQASWSGQGALMDYRVNLWKRRSNGLDNFHDFKDHDNFSFAGVSQLSDGSKLDIEFNFYNGKTGAAEFREFQPRDRKVNGFSAKIAWQKNYSANSDFGIKAYYSDRDEDDLTFTIPLYEIVGLSPEVFKLVTGSDDVFYRTGYSTHKGRRADLEGQYSWHGDGGFKAVVGLGVRQDFLKSISYFPQKGEVEETSFRSFANIQQPLSETVLLNLGLLYENTGDQGSHWSPRLSLNWEFKPQQSLRIAASQAYRQPSLLEANFDTKTELSNGFLLDQRYISDENLEAEKILNLNLAYQGKSGFWQWELSAYREALDNMIDYASDRSVIDPLRNFATRIGNYDSYDSQGIEGEISYRPQLNKFIRFHFNRGSSHHYSLLRINPSLPRIYKDRAPKWSAGIFVSYPINQWQAGYSIQYMDEVYWDGFGDRVKSYTRMDLSLAKTWDIGDKELEVKFGALSFNSSYQEFNEDLFIEPQYYLGFTLAKR
ncbi:TonB-dependent receptor [uncultured Pseudoteredinibacter sp.]|uniref:TonB-dependent receptor plug domain-containing protein n=1 Tax=uncultured Pseudoteredinibacter sp. TaxID=1641701 RepID=UPI00260478E5|nr:TonB-dependent receptor [uncultured Pseudoteredinibacter sp.]